MRCSFSGVCVCGFRLPARQVVQDLPFHGRKGRGRSITQAVEPGEVRAGGGRFQLEQGEDEVEANRGGIGVFWSE